MKVALYARVSSSRQRERGTVASQIEALRSRAHQEHYDVEEEYVCVDDGVSGATLDRPELDRLRDGAQAGRFDAVLVHSPDRLSRKYAYLILVLEEFERLGVDVIFLEQPPAEDPHSALLVQIQGAVAEYERAKLAERYRRGKLHRARQGEVFWNSIPFGYRRIPRQDGVPAHVVVDEEQAEIVRKVFRWHAWEGLSIRKITHALTASGVRPPRGGKRWGETTIHKFLRREAYLGTLCYNQTTCVPRKPGEEGPGGRRLGPRVVLRPPEEWIPISIPPIVDRETFERSLSQHGRNQQFSPRRLKEERWLLRRLLRCGVCGRKHACVSAKGRPGERRYYYRCTKSGYLADSPPCRPSHVRAAPLDDVVWREIHRHLLDPRLLLRAHRILKDGEPLEEDLLGRQIEAARRRLSQVRSERERLRDAYQGGFIEKEAFEERARKIAQRMDDLAADLDALEKQQSTLGGTRRVLRGLTEFTRTVSQRLDGMSFHERQNLAREVLEEVVLDVDEVHLHFRIPFAPPPEKAGEEPSQGTSEEVSRGFHLRSRAGDSVEVRLKVDSEGSEGLERDDHPRHALGLHRRLPERVTKDLPCGPSHQAVKSALPLDQVRARPSGW